MKTVIVFVILIYNAVNAIDQTDCQTGERGLVEIVNVTTAVVISIGNSSDVSATLNLEYAWDIATVDGIKFDGFLYKLEETKGWTDEWSDYTETESKQCNTTSQKELWAETESGESVRCKMPCSKYFREIPSYCNETESVCSLREDQNFNPLPKHARSISVNAEFGGTYYLRLYAYHQWSILSNEYGYTEESITIFCINALVNERGLSISEAKYHCRNVSTATSPSLISGPPADFEKHSITYDVATNMGQIVFRWKEPFDVSPVSPPITKYTVAVGQGDCEKSFIYPSDRHNDSFFYVKIIDAYVGIENHIRVTPYNSENLRGLQLIKKFTIPEINACLYPHRYCSREAKCFNLPIMSEAAARCECKPGYFGNGVNISFEGGEGCTDFDACRRLNYCVEHAECQDKPPPSMEASCTCRPGYIGDGNPSGYGCRKLSSIVLLAMVVPMGLLSLFAVYCCVKRLKHIKKGSEQFSRFLVSSNAKYTAPLQYFNEYPNNSSGAFGAAYELDRDMVELKDVLGRGNFGVVYNGTLKTESGNMQVAVKTTAEPHSREMEMEFLSEIAVIVSLGTHEHILGMIGCCSSGAAPTYLVTQFMKYGDLLHFLWDCREESKRVRDPIYILKEGNIYNIAKQVASGLQYITGIRIIHGDIAARNVLVDENLQCKISDFGLANDVYLYGMVKEAREKRVPIRWISPERMQAGRVPITWRSDVWSFGILLYEMSTLGATPFTDVSIHELFEKLISGYRMAKPMSCSPFLYDIMTRCWEWIPSNRPTFKELVFIMAEAARTAGSCRYENVINEM